MSDLEHELKRALTRKDPPPMFEARVLAAARPESRGARGGFWRLRWVSAIAAALLTFGGAAWQHQRTLERARGEEAKARLMLALKIASTKLQKIQNRVDEIQ
jgi:hypothetical protein